MRVIVSTICVVMTLILLSSSKSATTSAADVCGISEQYRQDCGYSGMTQTICESYGCCWKVPQSGSGNIPYCFRAATGTCSVPTKNKIDCGFTGITQSSCEQKGCCWVVADGDDDAPQGTPQGTPYCYYHLPEPVPPAGQPPYNMSERALLFKYFTDNIDIQGRYRNTQMTVTVTAIVSLFVCLSCLCLSFPLHTTNIHLALGPLPLVFLSPCPPPPPLSPRSHQTTGKGGVVAAPDTTVPDGGSYYFHWARDGAISMRAYLWSDPNFNTDDERMQAYVQWVLRSHVASDPHNMDPRIEPKFLLPGGQVFPGAWCRPQNDAPGLRARTLIDYANKLIDAGNIDYVRKFLYSGNRNDQFHGGAIAYDLDWILGNWQSTTCDLWEEVTANDFFWNRFTMKNALTLGAQLAAYLGDAENAGKYNSTAKTILAAAQSNFNGAYIQESSIRKQDGAVLCALNNGYNEQDGVFGPTDPKVAKTIFTIVSVFNNNYAVNGVDFQRGVPGVLIGRYPGDTYSGGNPWLLTTHCLGELYYRGASEVARKGLPSDMTEWANLFGSEVTSMSDLEFALTLLDAGDGQLKRVRYHIEGADFHMPEQLQRDYGFSHSAIDLTWSYGTALKALASRDNAVADMKAAAMLQA
jgi:glucoamylase